MTTKIVRFVQKIDLFTQRARTFSYFLTEKLHQILKKNKMKTETHLLLSFCQMAKTDFLDPKNRQKTG